MQQAIAWQHHKVNNINLLIVATVEVTSALLRQLDLAKVNFDLNRLPRLKVISTKNLLLCVTQKHKFLSLIMS
jgi:hypothetical protein